MVFQSAGLSSTKLQILAFKRQSHGTAAPFAAKPAQQAQALWAPEGQLGEDIKVRAPAWLGVQHGRSAAARWALLKKSALPPAQSVRRTPAGPHLLQALTQVPLLHEASPDSR